MTLGRTRSLVPALMALAVALAVVLAVTLLVVRDDRGPRTFYVSPDGSDKASGSSPGTAWRSLSRVGEVDLVAARPDPARRPVRRQRLYLPKDASGDEDHPIVVTSFGAERATSRARTAPACASTRPG